MKIVIDIPEGDYLNLIKTDENGEKEISLGLLMFLWDCVKYNCTPLPKGHGRLIDADELKRIWKGCKFVGSIGPVLDCRPTIIEADKESEEEE